MKVVQESTLKGVMRAFDDFTTKDNIWQDSTWFDYELLKAALQRKQKSITNFLLE